MNHLNYDSPFWEYVTAARHHQDYQQHYTTMGPQPHVILTYTGSGVGGPQYRCMSADSWERFDQYGWEVIATVDPDGTVTES